MARVLIAGCGALGTRLGLLLSAAGDRVFGLRRDPSALPAGIEPLRGDLAHVESSTLPDALDLVFYAAAADDRSEDAYRRAYVEGVRNLLGALDTGGQRPRRIVLVSSTGVYAEDDGGAVDEASPVAATGRGALLAEGERAWLAAGRDAVLARHDPVVARLGGIYGPGRTRLVERVLNGEARYPRERERFTNRIHELDAAFALAQLADAPLDAAERVVNVVDREPAELAAVLGWLAQRLGAPEPEAVAAEAFGGGRGKRVSCGRLLATGFAHRYPTFREGYEALIAELGAGPFAARGAAE